MQPEWKGRTAFAEYAEVVGVSTTDVLAAWWKGEGTAQVNVLFTRDIQEIEDDTDAVRDAAVYQQALDRDADGVLVKYGDEEVVGTGRDFGF